MRFGAIDEFELEGRRIWRTWGGFVLEGLPVRLRDESELDAAMRVLDLAERGASWIRPPARTALERIRDAGADPRLMRALLDRAVDGADHHSRERAELRSRFADLVDGAAA